MAHLGRKAQKNGSPSTYSFVQSNLNHARIPLALARESGCNLTPILAHLTWQSVLGTIQTTQLPKGGSGLVRFVIARGSTPLEFNEFDLGAFVRFKTYTGRNRKYARRVARSFRKFGLQAGLTSCFPGLSQSPVLLLLRDCSRQDARTASQPSPCIGRLQTTSDEPAPAHLNTQLKLASAQWRKDPRS